MIRGWFRYSFMSKILAINIGGQAALLENSRIMSWFIKCVKRANYLISKVSYFNLFPGLKRLFLRFPVRMLSLIGISATLTNILLLSLLKNEISLFSWLVRIIFFLACLAGLFCHGNYQEIKEESVILNFMKIGKNKPIAIDKRKDWSL
jgi:hypothetical protein